MLRQSGNILDIAKAIRSGSYRVLGFDHQHPDRWSLSYSQFMYARSCRWRLPHAMASVRLPGFILLKKFLNAAWRASRNLIAYGNTIAALSFSST